MQRLINLPENLRVRLCKRLQMLSFFQCRGSLTTILVTSQLAQELDPFIYLTIELKRQRNWSFQTFSGELFTVFLDYKFSLTKCR